MVIAVIGAGAIGSAIAAALAGAGRDVILVARGDRLARLQAAPLRLQSGGTTAEIAVQTVAADALGTLPQLVDLAICCVKSPDLEPALVPLRAVLPRDGIVLTLQNGVEAHEMAAHLLPQVSVFAGRVHGFFEMHGDLVRHAGVAPSIELGRTSGRASPRRALAAFRGTGIAVRTSPDITLALWKKFLLAASLGSVACAAGIPAGKVLSVPGKAALLRAAMAEIVALAATRGIGLTDSDIAQCLAFVGSFPPDVTTSLQRDIAAGRRSEFEALTVAVSRLSYASGLVPHVFPQLERAIARKYAILKRSRPASCKRDTCL